MYAYKLTSRSYRSTSKQRDYDSDKQLFTVQTYRILNAISLTYVRKLGYSSKSRNLDIEWKTIESWWFFCRQREGTSLFSEASRPAVRPMWPPIQPTTVVIFPGESDRCVRLTKHLHLDQCGGRLVLHASNLQTSKPSAGRKQIIRKDFFSQKVYFILSH